MRFVVGLANLNENEMKMKEVHAENWVEACISAYPDYFDNTNLILDDIEKSKERYFNADILFEVLVIA